MRCIGRIVRAPGVSGALLALGMTTIGHLDTWTRGHVQTNSQLAYLPLGGIVLRTDSPFTSLPQPYQPFQGQLEFISQRKHSHAENSALFAFHALYHRRLADTVYCSADRYITALGCINPPLEEALTRTLSRFPQTLKCPYPSAPHTSQLQAFPH